MKAQDLTRPIRIACLAICLLAPAQLPASQPLDACPVDDAARVRVCDDQRDNCRWIGYCAYLGFGPDALTDPAPFDRIAATPCAEWCNREHTSLDAREACYEEQCGIQPAPFRDALELPTDVPQPCQPRIQPRLQQGHGMPQSNDDAGPIGLCLFTGGAHFGTVSRIDDGEPSSSLGLGLEVFLTHRFAVELQAARQEIEASDDRETLDLDHLSVHAKLYLSDRRIRPFLKAGLGLVDVDPGRDGIAFHGGGGLDALIGDRTSLEVSATYRTSEVDGPDIEALDWLVGWKFHF